MTVTGSVERWEAHSEAEEWRLAGEVTCNMTHIEDPNLPGGLINIYFLNALHTVQPQMSANFFLSLLLHPFNLGHPPHPCVSRKVMCYWFLLSRQSPGARVPGPTLYCTLICEALWLLQMSTPGRHSSDYLKEEVLLFYNHLDQCLGMPDFIYFH